MTKHPETRHAHVWIVPLPHAPAGPAVDDVLLSAEERARCGRLHDVAARRRFIQSRHALRLVLAAQLGRDARSLVFTRGERGKPAVEGAAGIDFSFSDCRDYALIALAAAPTGVDGEHVRELRRLERTARRIFHPETVAALESLPRADRTTAFLSAWTQREAHVKAVGGGLFHTSDVLPFDASLPADARPRAVAERGSGAAWSVARFQPSQSTVATLAVHGRIDTLTIHRAVGADHLQFTETTRHERA